MTGHELLIAPFVEFGFLRRALLACVALGLGAGPIGVMLVLRRMSLVGDALSHAILPGAAIGFLIAGLSYPAMGMGGLLAGLLVALLSGQVSRSTVLGEEAAFACFYLTSLASGVLLVSWRGSNVDLMHVLFGTILAIDAPALLLVGSIASLSWLALAWFWRPLVAECFDAEFLRQVDGRSKRYHFLFLVLVVINLVAGFQTLGTLMAVGMIMLPAAIARLWTRTLETMMVMAILVGWLSGYLGLLISFHGQLASGPAIVLTAGLLFALSLLAAPAGRIWQRLFSPSLAK
ncbi:MAG: metal ABC transporter permease [Magnetococcales bacterium]|nr:metal ABC transporter permease [Magnetococcales bacterium]